MERLPVTDVPTARASGHRSLACGALSCLDVHYYRRFWDERRGDAFSGWGAATYLFETDNAGTVIRQVEVYRNGNVLRYGHDHRADEYGQLSDQPLDLADFEPFRIAEAEFAAAWPAGEVSGPDLRQR